MDALISGQSGLAILVRGNDVSVVRAEMPQEVLACTTASIPYLLAGASDVQHLKSTSQDEVLAQLAAAVEADYAFRFVLILLDQEEDHETRTSATHYLVEMLRNEALYAFVANRLYGAPLPAVANTAGARAYAPEDSYLAALLTEVAGNQPSIAKCCEAWDAVPLASFADEMAKRRFGQSLIASGAFRNLVRSMTDPNAFGLAQLHAYRSTNHLPRSREVVGMWLEPLIPERSTARQSSSLEGSTEYQDPQRYSQPTARAGKSHAIFENIQKQKRAIVKLLKNSDFSKVRKYVDELVAFQMRQGQPEYAAKSLCDLANRAKDVSNYSLQLELALHATEVAPGDGWSYGQVADAYICLGQYERALHYLNQARGLGETAFALTGQARILREQGLLEQSLKAYEQAISQFPDEMIPRIARAEVLREMWQYDAALHAYEEIANTFPMERVPQCGMAAVLKDLGQLDKASALYDNVIFEYPDDVVPRAGRADVLKAMGRLDDALSAYTDIIRKFPDISVPYCGRADVLKQMGRLEDALKGYEDATGLFPYEPVCWNGRADVLSEKGECEQALAVCEQAILRFPRDNRIRNAKANILKRLGRFDIALQAYDQNVADFPYDMVAWSGRADLLKRLGHLDDALAAYERLIARDPRNQSVCHAKAAILVVMGRYDEADSLLPKHSLRTSDDWIGYHIRGMMYLKSRRFAEAIEVFETGLQSTPFAREQKYYQSALVTATLRNKQFQDAIRYLPSWVDPLTDVLRLHAFGATRQFAAARAAYDRVQSVCPPNLVGLRDALASWYGFGPRRGSHDWEWVFEEECRAILLEAA